MYKQTVTYGDWKFQCTTFDDPVLRDLHLQFTTADLIQAVGRGRILRKKNTIYLFSNIPIENAEQTYLKKSSVSMQ